MKNLIRVFSIAILFVILSCSPDDDGSLSTATDKFEDYATQNKTDIDNDYDSPEFPAFLLDEEIVFGSLSNDRMELINRSILPDKVEDNTATVRSDDNGQQPYYWTWVARVTPPSLDGHTLSATHCSIKDNRAYVSYHKQGNIHLGRIEIVDITTPSSPTLIQQINFLNADINYIKVESNESVWLAASHEKHGAIVYQLNVTEGTSRRINLSNKMDASGVTASANGIDFDSDNLYVTSGKSKGGHFVFSKGSLELIDFEPFSNAKAIAVNTQGSFVSLTTGEDALLRTSSKNNPELVQTFGIEAIDHANVALQYKGKNSIYFNPYNENRIYVSRGQNGLTTYDINTGAVVNQSKGTMLLQGNTNAVTLDDTYMYVANGADGIAICEHVTDHEEITPIFNWDMQEQPASANYITGQDDWIFICKGQGGFNILYRQEKMPYTVVSPFDNTGKPIVLEEDEEICQELLPKVFNNVLPERQNALLAHPEYFTHPQRNLILTEDSEVKLTFLHEGAGYKNILGYYVYDGDNPPQTTDDLEKIIIFPNASAQNSGGSLVPGNTVKLLGEFEAGTQIGFFVIANGWRNEQITDGITTQYTNPEFNQGQHTQALLFHDPACGSTIICFEDISIPNGDKDYNDAIFEISLTASNGIDTDDYIGIE